MLNAASQLKSSDGGLTHASAIRSAWILWVTLGTIPMIMFLYVVWNLLKDQPASSGEGHGWFLASCIYLLVVVPSSFFIRSQVWKAYWAGNTVHPAKYLVGMGGIWAALVIGGLLSLAGCLQYHTLLPDLLPALVAFMFFVVLWPSGSAMTHRGGASEDAAVYEEPS